ncbi:DUF2268 domain-containing putative Zn-dependent protease [Pseudoxanthomonas sp. 22568]|uniref:DUF2268 domain-containing putative Zn-dependent protease n=1 Tax=Pseudoxanthomonas sp. 22568 TaxID=3453945 RepID=UPI003F85C525
MLGLAAPATLARSASEQTDDPLLVEVETTDAWRFARVFKETGGTPTAARLQTDYLSGAGFGVEVFTPDRIVDADNLARAVAAHRDRYRHAIEVCLPEVEKSNAQLRAVYLAYGSLFPGRRLPRVAAVFGAANSGGTADARSQVIGLEVACQGVTGPADFQKSMRHLFAHETIHSLQTPMQEGSAAQRDLLVWALREGAANFFAALVTGGDLTGADNAWAMERETELWRGFQTDRRIMRARWTPGQEPDAAAVKAATRWMWNVGNPPAGWPAELGYWIGHRILGAYYQRKPDKRAAIAAILALEDPDALLRESGYAGGAAVPDGDH